MLTLRDVELRDRDFVNAKLRERSGRNCELCFGNIFIWRGVYDIQIADYKDMLLVRMEDDEGEYFLAPAGAGDMAKAIAEVAAYFAAKGEPPRFCYVAEEDVPLIEAAAPGQFTATHLRDTDDYIHLTESLATLNGKLFHGKRGHIKRFESTYYHEYVSLTPEYIPAALELSETWCKQHAFSDNEEEGYDFCATKQLLTNFDELHAIGGAILVHGKMAGYSAGTPRYPGSDDFVVHLEKGLIEYEGIYSIVNHLFMRDIFERGFKYANREEDMGVPGLRKSKLSYNPELVLPKYNLSGR
ncbi:MAG TPA: phosphatidylglycerol lysyltransferase domain-containing protein [Terriglobales bacterium]|nr:phosphatidylglycerol lysyltransferase domain-containing protein [Terriglobales bacterium]